MRSQLESEGADSELQAAFDALRSDAETVDAIWRLLPSLACGLRTPLLFQRSLDTLLPQADVRRAQADLRALKAKQARRTCTRPASCLSPHPASCAGS